MSGRVTNLGLADATAAEARLRCLVFCRIPSLVKKRVELAFNKLDWDSHKLSCFARELTFTVVRQDWIPDARQAGKRRVRRVRSCPANRRGCNCSRVQPPTQFHCDARGP